MEEYHTDKQIQQKEGSHQDKPYKVQRDDLVIVLFWPVVLLIAIDR